jgi:ketosteroid isomerase-like protein
MTDPVALAEAFVRTTEQLAWNEETARALLHPDYVQTELPNLLNRNGQTSDVAQTLERSERAKLLLAAQRYTVTSVVAAGERVVLEADWSAELRIDAGPLRAGQRLAATFCMVFEIKDDRIHRIRNYDCFAPF